MPALVEVRTLPDDPGCTGYLITGANPGEVQDSITAIMNTVEDIGGEAQFRNPARSFLEGHMRWRSTGYVRVAA